MRPAANRNRTWKSLASQPLFISIVSAIVGGSVVYVGNKYIESDKARSEVQKIYLEHRMRLWVSTATHFPQYIINLRRLRIHAEQELARELTQLELERKKQAVLDRNRAREGLYGDLTQAKFFFSDAIRGPIQEFEDFDARNVDLPVTKNSTLPNIKEWEIRETAVLAAIRREFGDAVLPKTDLR